MSARKPQKEPSVPRASVNDAAALLRQGRLVAFPTETVYGLGADATNDAAVASVFSAKGRPNFNPLIVHLPDQTAVKKLVQFSPLAQKIADAFWPGAMTLILKRRQDCPISLLASAGLDTLAVRVPNHPLAHDLLVATGKPLAAPSANLSESISPTTAAHVEQSLGQSIDAILDGGACNVGLESTVILATGDIPVILRPGGLSKEEIEEAVGPVQIATENNDCPQSPGMMRRHYAPGRPLRLNADTAKDGEAYLGFGPGTNKATLNLSVSGDLKEAAANLFAMLHDLDHDDFSAIAVAPIPDTDLGLAINDRLRRAATPEET